MLLLALCGLVGCARHDSASGDASSAPASDQAASHDTKQAQDTYATAHSELGVATPAPGQPAPVCPYEVASWDKSLTSPGIAINVSVRGPTHLVAAVADVAAGGNQESVDGDAGEHQATTLVDSPTTPPATVASVMLTATAGPSGSGGSCRVAKPSDTGTGNDYCHAKPVASLPPDLVGLALSDALLSDRKLGCVDQVRALAPHGHDVTDDPMNQAVDWRITAVVSTGTPQPGEPVIVRVRKP